MPAPPRLPRGLRMLSLAISGQHLAASGLAGQPRVSCHRSDIITSWRRTPRRSPVPSTCWSDAFAESTIVQAIALTGTVRSSSTHSSSRKPERSALAHTQVDERKAGASCRSLSCPPRWNESLEVSSPSRRRQPQKLGSKHQLTSPLQYCENDASSPTIGTSFHYSHQPCSRRQQPTTSLHWSKACTLAQCQRAHGSREYRKGGDSCLSASPP